MARTRGVEDDRLTQRPEVAGDGYSGGENVKKEKKNTFPGRNSMISFRTCDSIVCLLRKCGKGAD